MELHRIGSISPGDWYHDVRDQLKWHIYRRAEAAFVAGDAARDALTTAEAVQRRQTEIRESFIRSIGGLPDSHGIPEALVSGVIQRSGFRIERLIYESRPRNYVTSLLYVPDHRTEPGPAVLFLCGHATQGKAYPEYQRVCQLLARSGFVVLAQDPIGQGERLSYLGDSGSPPPIGPCTHEHDHAGSQCVPVGWRLARFFLHDAMRSLDYLAARPEVDPSRIGLTGNSGGGTQSSLLMMTDPRIAAAAPGTFITNRRTYMYTGGSQDAEQIWPGFTASGFDHEDILIAMAPKPVAVLAVTDDFFPIEGTRRTVERCRRIWEIFGVRELPALVEDAAGHAYTRTLAVEATRFFSRQLRGADCEPDYDAVEPLAESEVRCSRSGQVMRDFPDAEAVFESVDRRRRDLNDERQRRSTPTRQRAEEFLRTRVAAHRVPCDHNARSYCTDHVAGLRMDALVWWSQPDLLGHALAITNPSRPLRGSPVTLALWDGGTSETRGHWSWIRDTVEAGRSVVVLDVSGVGALAPHDLLTGYAPKEFYGVIHKLADDLTWLNDNLAVLRTYDVLRAADMLRDRYEVRDLTIYALSGPARECVYGILAAQLAPDIRLEVEGEVPAYSDWVGERLYDPQNIKAIELPGVLEWFDLPEPLDP